MNNLKLKGLEVLDSRGDVTLKVVANSDGFCGSAIVPRGASTGKYEAYELTDKDRKRLKGQGLLNNISKIETDILNAIEEISPIEQWEIDSTLIKLDGSKNKENLGGNTLLGVSLAMCRLGANICDMPLFRYIGGVNAHTLPMPMFNVLNGGKHANNKIDTQEIMLVPIGAKTFKEAIFMGQEIYQILKKEIANKGFSTSLGDEGGFVLPFEKTEQALEFLKEVVNSSTYVLGEDFFISLDVASSSFYDKKLDKYLFEGKEYDSSSLIDFYQYLIDTYPILSIEDGLMEDDESWKEMTTRLGGQVLLVGDDLFVTNSELLQEGIKKNIANAIIIKPNQIGTLSETLNTIKLAQMSNYYPIISHRSGDSEDAFIADLAVGVNALFIKTGALGRSERTAKYNRLLEIEKELGVGAKFESAFIRSRVQKRKV